MNELRFDGRTAQQLRPISLQYDVYGYADASVLFSLGNTKILVSVSLQNNVPPFLKGQKTGWLSAEYAMLPHATQQRTQREATQTQRNARSIEISRLIGRCLRLCVDLGALGERTIVVDCDVLQADGGTRVAAITAASIALKCATLRWAQLGMTSGNIFIQQIAAISVGVVDGAVVADLAYEEDSVADADFNFVVSEHDELVELQGTSEKISVNWDKFEQLRGLAQTSIKQLLVEVNSHEMPGTAQKGPKGSSGGSIVGGGSKMASQKVSDKTAFFSLGHRLNK